MQSLGITGAILMAISGVAQLRSMILRRNVSISTLYIVILIAGFSLLVIYSIHIKNTIFIFCNSFGLLQMVAILFLLNKNKKRKEVLDEKYRKV